MQLSVIIVNYNVRFFLEQCLLSVYKAGASIDMEVIVVDNNSYDGSRSFLEPLFPQVQFYWLQENTGFSRACNYGLQKATGRYILFLNPDTLLPEDCFQKTLAFMQSHPDAGAMGVRMIDGSGRFLKESKRGLPSAGASFFKFTGLIRLFPRSGLFARYYSGHLPETDINRVDVLSGAFFLASREVLDRLGGFDEQFFMYGEDIDLSYRITLAGFYNYYFPGTTIIHFKGESTQKADVRYLQRFYGAMKIFVAKHYPRGKVLVLRALIQLVLWVKQCRLFFKKRMGEKQSGTPAQPPSFLVLGDEAGYQEVKQILGSYDGTVTYGGTKTGVMQDGDAVVLCEGAVFSFKTIIEQVDKAGSGTAVWIHAGGSNSIVTSASDRTNGTVIGVE